MQGRMAPSKRRDRLQASTTFVSSRKHWSSSGDKVSRFSPPPTSASQTLHGTISFFSSDKSFSYQKELWACSIFVTPLCLQPPPPIISMFAPLCQVAPQQLFCIGTLHLFYLKPGKHARSSLLLPVGSPSFLSSFQQPSSLGFFFDSFLLIF